ncbi:DegT/DnrJ/EryC1/StrS family aminotransferase [Parafrankia discariae]|uniref:DegT/DnrJ/EryC1/StrS family aminotransferase n=1 Tax=Parafrankia discariae TaxID=365528 RepID=UPI00036BDCCB|nr:aminotransferase class I/II-fold pyridoxal phosphate-dependent enzyme [Parafrankia discariae]
MAARIVHSGPRTFDIPGPHYQWPIIDDSLKEAIVAQTERSLSDRDSTGIVGEFEREFAAFVDAPHAISFSSGTSAIHAMSRIAGLGPGDAVLAPAYTFLATASPFAFEGVEVVFVDADEYGNVTAETLADQLKPNIRAVIVTHLWGNPCDMPAIAEFCREHGLLLLEDCSHAHFASRADQHVGSLADLAVYSTNQKAITTGEGGILTMSQQRYRDLALLFGHYNKRCQTEIDPAADYAPFAFTGMGLKHRLHPVAAAIGVHQLARAADIERRRRGVLDRFVTGLAGNPVISPVVVPPEQGQHGLYVTGLRYHPDNSTVSLGEFVSWCHAEGATEVDVPGSTRDISQEPLFTRRDPHAPYRVTPSPAPSGRPPRLSRFAGVQRFQDTFIKIPLWGYDGDDPMVEGYLAALTAVSTAVAA